MACSTVSLSRLAAGRRSKTPQCNSLGAGFLPCAHLPPRDLSSEDHQYCNSESPLGSSCCRTTVEQRQFCLEGWTASLFLRSCSPFRWGSWVPSMSSWSVRCQSRASHSQSSSVCWVDAQASIASSAYKNIYKSNSILFSISVAASVIVAQTQRGRMLWKMDRKVDWSVTRRRSAILKLYSNYLDWLHSLNSSNCLYFKLILLQ